MKLYRTTTFQLTVLYAVMLAISTLAVAIFLYWATIGFLQRQTDTTIEVEIAGLQEQYGLLGLNGLSRVIGDRIRSGNDPDALYLFANRQLRPLAGNLAEWPQLVNRDDGWYSFTNTAEGRNVPARARVLALPEGLVLLVGRDISDLDRLLGLAASALAWGAGLVIALSLAGGLFLSRKVLKRVESINETTSRIVSGDLSQRVPTRGTRDEFDQLAENLNRMLEQIEQLMGGIRHVGDSIAHDLRTPLTRLRHSLEEAAATQDSNAMRSQVDSAIEDADRLLATFAALLRIARIESGSYIVRSELLSLPRLVEDVLELYGVMAEEKGIRVILEMEDVPDVSGDRDLIFQLIVNLVDNSLKYTPANGELRISVEKAATYVGLVIQDTGCGIPEKDLDKVADRFYRVDASRGEPGSGLGLSLVQAVAELHDADLTFVNLSPGLRVDVKFAMPV